MDIKRKKLLYRATHRGTREADQLIGGFVREHLEHFSATQLNQLERLLEEADRDLLKWVVEKEPTPTRVNSQLVNQLIAFKEGL